MHAPAQVPRELLTREQLRELLDLIGRVCEKRGLPGPPQSLRPDLEALGKLSPQEISSDRDRQALAALQAGLRQLAEALPATHAALNPTREKSENDILLDVILRYWILAQYPGWQMAWFFLLWERHKEDIARGLTPFRSRLIEEGVGERRDSLWDLAADFLSRLIVHLYDNNYDRLRRWDPLQGPMGPWLRQVVWQLAWDLIRNRHPELRLEDEAGEVAEGLPWEERLGEAPLTGAEIENRLERVLDLERVLEQLEERDRYILWAAYGEGWTDDQIAECLRVRRETVNRRKRHALRRVFCILWKEKIREENLSDPRIDEVVAAYCEGRSEEEIARSLDLSVEEVEALLGEARRILRSEWGF